jgi:hypothetical protein
MHLTAYGPAKSDDDFDGFDGFFLLHPLSRASSSMASFYVKEATSI